MLFAQLRSIFPGVKIIVTNNGLCILSVGNLYTTPLSVRTLQYIIWNNE